MPDNSDQPFTQAELAAARAASAGGKSPSLETVRRFILTIRKAFTSAPWKTEKAKTASRNAKPKLSEDQMDFF